MLISPQEFKHSSLTLQVCVVIFFVTTAAAFVACVATFAKMDQHLADVSTSALFILLGIQNLLSLISGLQDGAFLLFGRRQPLIRYAKQGSSDFRRFAIVNSIFVIIAFVHITFTYLR
ncbi:MAG: hypothetical protein V4598_06845 [Bdellovibrionota bacterium]